MLAVVLVAGVLAVPILRDDGVFTSRTVVAFMLPGKTSLAMNSGLDDRSVIAFAGVVAQQINNGKAPTIYSEDEAPYYGAGIREGVVVSLPRAGNQWVTNYLRAEIQVQVVGASEQEVTARRDEIVARIAQASEALQVGITDPEARITATVVPLTTRVYAVSATSATTAAAAGALAVAGLIVAVGASVSVDRIWGRGWARRSVQLTHRDFVAEGSGR